MRQLHLHTGDAYIDLGTGTGDVLLAVIDRYASCELKECIGVDMSEKMLEIAYKKRSKHASKQLTRFIQADALNLPFDEASIDRISMTFAIRNVQNLDQCLQEIKRVLSPNGKVCILEFGLPSNALFKRLYLFYFRYILPILGGVISRNLKAYRYLNESVESFPYGQAFCDHLVLAGFQSIRRLPLTGGIVYYYEASV